MYEFSQRDSLCFIAASNVKSQELDCCVGRYMLNPTSEERVYLYNTILEMSDYRWYAMRTFHNKSSVVRATAQKDGVEWYTPIREKEVVVNDIVEVKTEELMPSLIFVRASVEWIERLRAITGDNVMPYCEPGSSRIYAIDDKEMDIFRFVARTAARHIDIVNDVELRANDRVRITGGIFNGMEGYILRIHGTRRFVVAIEGVAAIATTYIPKQFIEKINNS